MDWTLVVSGVTLALNAVVIGFWKPWLGAYGGEKGKNLARKEDLNEILAEVRAVTKTQKEIETKLADDLWNRQTLRNEKRAVYAEALATIHQATRACQNLAQWSDFKAKGLHWKEPTLDIETTLRTELATYEMAETELIRMASLVSIFARPQSAAFVVEYLKRNRRIEFTSTVEFIKEQRDQLINLSSQLVVSAKVDLGIPAT